MKWKWTFWRQPSSFLLWSVGNTEIGSGCLQQYTLLNFNLPRWMESPTKHLCLGAEDKDDKKKKKKVLSEGTVWEKVKKSHKSESIAAGLQNGHIW